MALSICNRCRDTEEIEKKGEKAAGDIGEGAEGTSWCIKGNTIDRDAAQNGQ